MVRIGEIYREGDFGLSIEVFPPKTATGDAALFQTLDVLANYRPAFVSCTYGAGGSTRTRTVELCAEMQKKYKLTATAHLTCVDASREQLIDWLAVARDSGIHNIMALRGDPTDGQDGFQQVEGGLRNANELVSLIRTQYPKMGIGVAGYPEVHQEAPDAKTDLQNLKRKVDAGADAVFTQLFYVNESFFKFRECYEQAGIGVPLIPGIMPITEFGRIKRITGMCGAVFPESLASRLEAVQHDKQAQFEVGVGHAIGQCQELIDQGVLGIHFYALNRSKACERILNALGMKPSQADCA